MAKVIKIDDDVVKLKVEDEISYPEGGYGWVIVMASFMVHVIAIGIPTTFGVFQPIYKESTSYEGSHATLAIAFIGSSAVSGLGLFSIPSGRMVDLFGHRLMGVIGGVIITVSLLLASFSNQYWQIILTQGVLFGMGCAIAYFPALTIIAHYFSARKGMATGFAVAGSGVGGLALAPILRYALANIGQAATLRWMALISGVIVIACSFVFKPRLPPAARDDMNYSEIIHDSKFIRMYIMSIVGSVGYFIPFFFIPAFALQNGMSQSDGALIVGLLNGASGIGRIFMGFCADRFGHINMLLICVTVGSLSILLIWPFATTFPLLTTFALTYGFFMGGYISLLPTAIVQLFGTKNIASIIGLIYSGSFFGNLFGTPAAGAMLDALTTTVDGIRKTNFTPSIMLSGFCILFSGILMLTLKLTVGKGKLFARV
ncbi:hypothetical protein HDV02_005162 [Globomyces sp. JEL0801]|nr:hypothetical protein HDV02_005162 [Globomyces sp. JEL0801]